MLWMRYRSVAMAAVPVGVLAGVILGVAVYLAGNPEYRAQGGPTAFWYWAAVGAVLGGGTALAALAGGALSILVTDRSTSRVSGARVLAGSVGAAVGAAVLWLAIGLFTGIASPAGSSWFGASVVIALVAAVAAGVLAALMLRRAERSAARIQAAADH